MKDNKTRERSRSGTFTLIELLIIVSIIAILAAMLLPALSKAREKANTINCASNLKGIGQMAAGYANDYGYILPSRMWTASTTAKTATQLLVDAELIKNVSSQTLGSTESYKNRAYRIFFCEKGSRIDDSSNTGQHGIYGDFGFNYYDGTEIGFQNANNVLDKLKIHPEYLWRQKPEEKPDIISYYANSTAGQQTITLFCISLLYITGGQIHCFMIHM